MDYQDSSKIMMMQAAVENTLLGGVHRMETTIKPFAEQYNLQPNDYALVISSQARMDDYFCLAQVVDIENYKKEFPDWHQRMTEMPYMLCKWWSFDYKTEELGWFSRVKLAPISPERAEEVKNWFIEHGSYRTMASKNPPDWLTEVYDDYAKKLATNAPDAVPTPVACGKCESTDTYIHGSASTKIVVKAGQLIRDGEEHFARAGEAHYQRTAEFHLHCGQCGSVAEIDNNKMVIDTLDL